MATYTELNKELTDEQQQIKTETHKFAVEVLRPASIELDKRSPEDVIAKGSVHWDVFRKAYELGHHKASLPEALGGAGMSPCGGQACRQESQSRPHPRRLATPSCVRFCPTAKHYDCPTDSGVRFVQN